ncbi:sensor histidine kinase [Paenibacillus chitinolyticus]|uniref:histidine kinase n=1 Tax=Paenibacillus chitinolyticus TaxID=79263 RepID=A0A410WQ27_9BACL|nr:sensor histidine kinase [Paenibacillus chitinolyticus]MCY9591010.1 sensor histidine kinase [Paenibacillus chitinolyticus]MCY9597189.1 sensor histidine kinase [Paenibacillus chitinolyticus]QAV16441.1 sensor histidine kinase [Paenibacillus chitinolyticus]
MAKIMNWLQLKRMSLLQSFIFLGCLMLIAVLAVIVVEFQWAESLRQRYAAHSEANDWILPSLIALVLLTVAVGIVLMASLFYRWKLRKPLDILMKASEKISSDDLGFRISYDGKDEMGELCRAFEIMRGQLEKNYTTLWRSIEERKQLNAIFAHDLRTPLSVLKGNFEFLSTYLPQNKISEEKLLDMIQTMSVHIVRLEKYTEAMSSIQKMEDMPIHSHSIEMDQLIALLNESARQIIGQYGRTFNTSIASDSQSISVDTHLVLQVFENITANAARFASGLVRIHYCVKMGYLSITVLDDGTGFSEADLHKAMLPFYRGEVSNANEHHGMGLYTCKILCEKHEGNLQIDNGPSGGGQVTASFLTGLINS